LIVSAFSLNAQSAGGQPAIDGWTGKLSEPGVVIDIHDLDEAGNAKVVEGYGSRLELKKASETSVDFSIVHMEANTHSCEIGGKAKFDPITDSLTFTEKSSVETDEGRATCVLRLEKKDGEVRVVDVDNVCRREYCGARTGLDGLSFSLNSRIDGRGRAKTTLLPEGRTKLCFRRIYGTDAMKKDKDLEISSIQVEIGGNDKRPHDAVVTVSKNGPELATGYSSYQATGKCDKLNSAKGLCKIGSPSGRIQLQNNRDGSIFVIVPSGQALSFDKVVTSSDHASMENLELKSVSRKRVYKLAPSKCPQG
jgi:hypothetical protein